MGFNEGRLAGFVALLLISALTFLYAKKSMSKMPKIRAISGLNGMEEAIGRATEMGKPIHFSPGTAALVSEDAPQVFAALSVLEWVGKKAAQKGNNKIICTIRYPEVMPLAQEALKRAYNSEGRADLYSDDMVRYLSTAQFAYAAGTIAIMEREQIAANFMMGSWIGESLILLEVGNKIGAIQWLPYLTQLSRRPAALKYTGIYPMLPNEIQQFLDSCSYQAKKDTLRILAKLTEKSSFSQATQAVRAVIVHNARDVDSVVAMFNRLNSDIVDLDPMVLPANVPEIPPVKPNLNNYDRMFLREVGHCES